MNRKTIAVYSLLFLLTATAIGAYAGTIGVNDLFGFTNGYGFTWLNSTNVNATDIYSTDVDTVTIDVDQISLDTVNKTNLLAYPQLTASYIIFQEGGVVYAKNGTTGQIDFEGPNAATIIQNTIDAVGVTGSGWIHLIGQDFSLSGPLNFTVSADWLLTGDGQVSSFTLLADGSFPALPIIQQTNGILTLRDLSVRGDGGGSATFGYLASDGANDIQIQNCIFWYKGLSIGKVNAWITNNWIENVEAGYGIYITTPQNINVRITDNYIFNCLNAIRIFDLRFQTANRITIIGNNIYLSKEHGIVIDRCRQGITINSNIFFQNGVDTPDTFDDLYIYRSQDVIVTSNKFGTAKTNPSTRYGINLVASALEPVTRCIITQNDFLFGGKSATDNPSGTNPPEGGYYTQLSGTITIAVGNVDNIIKDNIGFVTENRNTTEVYNTNTTATIIHNLDEIPTGINLTPTWIADVYITGINANNFNVTFTDPTATKDLYWEAYYDN